MHTQISLEQCKAIAQAEAMGDAWFAFGGKVWAACEIESRQEAWEWMEKNGEGWGDIAFMEYLEETQIELEYDASGDYIVLTDEEAGEFASRAIRDSLWAFNARFLSDVTGFDYALFKAIQSNNKFEENNDLILSLVDNNPKNIILSELIEEAIKYDGRGRFISSYDSKEEEFNCYDYTGKNEYLYIYRIN